MSEFLYPKPHKIEADHLDVGHDHQIYYEVSGNPDGVSIVHLHGGPGAGFSGREHRFFDPDYYRIILFDQRGAGRSLPYAETKHNSPETLIVDIHKLRKHLNIGSWAVSGGSWGSSLALLYATKYPQNVDRLLLRGVFFADARGSRHIIEANGGAAAIQPKYFEQYAYAPYVPESARQNLTQMYHDVFAYGDEKTQIDAAMRFDLWDTSIAYAQLNEKALQSIKRNPRRSLALAKLFFHFTVNYYIKNDYKKEILDKLDLLAKMPIDIVHGECDWICPVDNAYELKRKCPHANLNIVLGAGHTMADPLIKQAFIETLNNWRHE